MQNQKPALAPLQCRLNRIRKPDSHSLSNHNTVHNNFDRVNRFCIQSNGLAGHKLCDLPIDPSSHKSFASQSLQHIAKFTTLTIHHRCQQHEPRLRGECGHSTYDFRSRLSCDRTPCLRIMRLPQVRIKQSKIIVNLRRSCDRRARITGTRSLLNRDGG